MSWSHILGFLQLKIGWFYAFACVSVLASHGTVWVLMKHLSSAGGTPLQTRLLQFSSFSDWILFGFYCFPTSWLHCGLWIFFFYSRFVISGVCFINSELFVWKNIQRSHLQVLLFMDSSIRSLLLCWNPLLVLLFFFFFSFRRHNGSP